MEGKVQTDSFLRVLRRSRLVGDSRMAALTTEFDNLEAAPGDASAVADALVRRGIVTAWQAAMLRQGKHRGFRLGPYRILSPLGRGGMGNVFLAEHGMLRRHCAIKVLPRTLRDDPILIEHFHLEARALAALDHTHIVRAYDFNVAVRRHKRVHYLVMEYVEGQDLRQMVEMQGVRPYRQAADFIRQAAEGLAHLHEAGFVHRDVKPANMLVGPGGLLKILDLGMAKFAQDIDRHVQTEGRGHAVMGTADYVAPEQTIDSRTVDGRADIYSLGHSLYFLLTGRRPFARATVQEVLKAHRDERPEPIDKTRPDVPAELVSIFEKMTAKRPAQRYSTARDVVTAIQSWLDQPGPAGHSRIKAMKATARCAAQPSPIETQRNLSAPNDTSCLELAPVDDQPQLGAKAKAAKRKGAPDAEPAIAARRLAMAELPEEYRPTPPEVDWISRVLSAESLGAFPTVHSPIPRRPRQDRHVAAELRDRVLQFAKKSPWLCVVLAATALVGLPTMVAIAISRIAIR